MFYSFIQNKVGGIFFTNDKLCREMIIEANTLKDAECRAEELGCYFDGVEKGYDSGRDGDRWDRGQIMEITSSYSLDVLERYIEKHVGCETRPDIRVFYLEGAIEDFCKENSDSKVLSPNLTVESDVKIGDVFYHVKAVDTQVFNAPCEVCGNTKLVTLAGKQYECPACKGLSGDSCPVRLFAVLRYRVSELSQKTSTDFRKPSTSRTNTVTLFHRVGKGSYDSEFAEKKVELGAFVRALDNPAEYGKESRNGYGFDFTDSLFFSDYKLACDYAEKRNSMEEEKLERFNKAHNSNYTLDRSKRENDKPSK